MWKTVLGLLITLLVVPALAFYFDEPLSESQLIIVKKLTWVYLIAALACFTVSTISNNYSQVDKLWSLIPLVYVWMVAFYSGFEVRIVIMAVLVSAWGFRLTYNFSRRGGYHWRFWEGDEDYRWAVLRARPEFTPTWRWVLFNLFFISLYQMGLILLFTLPTVRSLEGAALSWTDYLLAGLFLLILLAETIADQQQWNFHKAKRAGEAGKGFLHKGLWGKVRHPNYAAEQGIWLVIYFYSVSATGAWLNWSVIGVLLLMVLFWSSSNFSESISASKYPDYIDYKRNTPRFIPLKFFRKPSAHMIDPAKPEEMIRKLDWLKEVEEKTVHRVIEAFEARSFPDGVTLIEENDDSDSGLFVLVKGKVKVEIRGVTMEVLGQGSIIGEMAVLTAYPRTATVIAATAVETVWIRSRELRKIMKDSRALENALWEFASMRFAMNLLGHQNPYNQWEQNKFIQWLSMGEVRVPDEKGVIVMKNRIGVLLIGTASSAEDKSNGEIIHAPASLSGNNYSFSPDAKVFIREK